MITTVDELLQLLSDDRSLATLVGTCRTFGGPGEPIIQAVVASGNLLRVEEPPGIVDTIVGADFVWHRWPDSGRVVRKPLSEFESNPYTQPRILLRSSEDYWRRSIGSAGAGVLSSVSRAVAHGRAAVLLTIPTSDGKRLDLTVDESTGTWLEARVEGSLWLDWEHIEFDVAFDPEWLVPPPE